ncbi:MAG: tRNA (N6-isopentenyl adenosine(37)-C2)-methylthiotransferase MiaB [Albidovulum sp.]|nr:tRNA (N6-isopentenyl adenosine(37)-C2)-methylthiotransferase MiaB [Albidovulum sp.]
MADSKKAFVKSYGCQMNVYDSERMAETMAVAGYSVGCSEKDADLIVLNTCHIREKATEKIYSELGRLKPLKLSNPSLRVAVAGCVAQAEGEEIIARQPLVDIVVGPQSYHQLPELVSKAEQGRKSVATDFLADEKFERLPKAALPRKSPTAFLTVQEGCDKFCTFCVVPYTRGAEYSRPAARIVAEAAQLADRGVREITLLGQNVNAYHGEGVDGRQWGLAALIRAIADIGGIERIRYTTSHPSDMSGDLIEAHASCAKLMPYLHLPVQSGSDKILKAMNRKHTSGQYLRLIESIRRARPDILISGDFIVGFPGETESDFEDTLRLVDEIGYGQSYSFRYSPRPGTPAAERVQIPPDVASERLRKLQLLLKKHQRAAQDSMVGRVAKVLFERRGRQEGQLAGKSEYLQAVHVDCDEKKLGEIAEVRIIRSDPNSLAGELVN